MLITQFCLPAFCNTWGQALFPVLDRFVQVFQTTTTAAAAAAVDEEFWQNMVKRGGTQGSGARTWYSGWINVFFPILAKKKANPYCVPYSPKAPYVRSDTAAPPRKSRDHGEQSQTGPEDWEFLPAVSSVN